MVEISKKVKQQRAYAVVALIFLVIGAGIFVNSASKKEGAFSDEAKLLRKCKRDAKSQIARKPKIESVYGRKIVVSGLNAFGMRMPMTFQCTKSGYANSVDQYNY